jgi:predicted transcriptional regulator
MTQQETRPAISEAERAVLKVLWDQGPQTVREVQELLAGPGQEWTRSTVITLLQRLERKGYAASDRSGFAFVFRAAVSLEDVVHQRMTALAEELSAGKAAPLVLAFAERHKFTDAEIERLRKLIDQLEAKRSSRRKAGK